MNGDSLDYELALRAQQGDRDALAELVARTRVRLFALAYAELRHYDDAQDAVANALLRICRHVKALREPERVHEWMNGIVRNEARRLRTRAGSPPLSLEEADGYVETPCSFLLRLDIERAMLRLPEDEARVSRLFYLADLSIAEIARQTGRPEGTIKSWLHRGRRHLATELEAYDPMKRREALKLLAATPALATTLEEAMADREPVTPPSTPVPAQTAAIIHTDLKPALVQKITEALRAGGYSAKLLTPTDPALILAVLKEYQVILLDEWIGGRSALEYLLHLRARPDTRGIPVGLLGSDPTDFTVAAYFAAGVGRLIDKNKPDEIARLAEGFERPETGAWARFTEPARQVIFLSQEEATALGDDFVGTEHLLLGLLRLPDSVGAEVLRRAGVSLESIRDEVLRHVGRKDRQTAQGMQLTPQAKTAIDQTYAEAWANHDYDLRVEHLLIGMLREAEGLAAQVLVKLGVTLERARAEVRALESA